jgi:hypothetical protein
MFKLLIIISGVALLLLAAVTVILVKLNWSEKLYSPLLSLGLAGTVTTFITVLLMLKGEVTETSFTTLMVINTQTHLPPFLGYSARSELNNRLSSYSSLSNPKVNMNGKEQILFDSPKNDTEEIVFEEELIQYKLFKEIVEMHYERRSMSQGIAGVSSNFHKPFKLSEAEKKPLSALASELAKNRFSNNTMEKFSFDKSFSKLPKDTKIEFKRIPSSEKTGVEKHLIILSKPYYFTIEIIIEAGFATGPNSIPHGLEITPEAAKICKTAMFTVTMKSNFEKITAGNWRTEELKNWTKWMFKEIENKYSDNKQGI